MTKIDKEVIKAYALKNAIEHSGKAIAGSVISGLFNHGLEKEGIKDIMPIVNTILREVNAISLKGQKKEFEKLKHIIGHRHEREGLPELENVKKTGVVMRFAPSPSGLLHIGHIMTGMINSLYVKRYKGKFYFRIEDTNPENIYKPAYKLLKKEADWIFGNVTKYIMQSDRIKIYYKYIKKLINKKAVYICTCDSKKFKELIDNQKTCPCRNISKKENLERWKKMLSKKGYKEGKAVVRFKSELMNPNPAMRDFPLARIDNHKHPRQGRKYRVWPLMNLSVSIDDIEFKTSHAIRGKDHRDNALRQRMIYKSLGLEKEFPKNYFLGRYNFIDLELSASTTRKAIEERKYSGWDDIRLPFLASLIKRGYQKQAFEKLVEQRGISEVDKLILKKDFFDVLDNFNREILKDKCRKTELGISNEKNSNMIMLMPDGKKIFGEVSIKPKKHEIIHFMKLGYAKFNGFEGKNKTKKLVFWFCHE